MCRPDKHWPKPLGNISKHIYTLRFESCETLPISDFSDSLWRSDHLDNFILVPVRKTFSHVAMALVPPKREGECLRSKQVLFSPVFNSPPLSSFSWIRMNTVSFPGSSTGNTGSQQTWTLLPSLHPCHLMGSSVWMDQGNRPLALSAPFPSLVKRGLLSLQPPRSRCPFSNEFFKMRKFPHQWLKLSRLVLKLINTKGRPKLLS